MTTAAVGAPSQVSAASERPEPTKHSHDVSCAAETRNGYARCHSKTLDRSDADPTPKATTSPSGLSPANIKMAYAFPAATTAGAGTTVAIVDAYHSATAAADLGQFSTTFEL